MLVTNNHGLPKVLVESIENDAYDSGRPPGCKKYVTISQLVRPPQINYLSRIHADELEVDAADQIWALLGSGFHATRERLSDSSHVLIEERFYAELAGWTVSGKIDAYDHRDGTLIDYKVTKVYATEGEMKQEWARQLQFNGWLMRRQGWETNRLCIIALLKDWSATRARLERDYPQVGVVVLETEPMDDDEVELWVLNRLAELEQDPPRRCTDSERWCRGGHWAVMKKGLKRARRLLDSYEGAELWRIQQPDASQLSIVEREKEFVRCQDYCHVCRWCPQLAAEAPTTQMPVEPEEESIPF